MLPNEVHQALGLLLQGLQSPDNVIRSQAEQSLTDDWVVARPDFLLEGLVEQAQAAADVTTRSFAAVLFRRMATKSKKLPDSETTQELYTLVNPQTKNEIQKKLLECLSNEKDNATRNKVGDAVAEVARLHHAEDQPWNELLSALHQASNSEDSAHREIAFRIFSVTPDIIERQHEDIVIGVFKKGFADTTISVRISATEAFVSFFMALETKAQRKYFPLIQDIFLVAQDVANTGDEELLTRVLISLIDLAETTPKMFKNGFNDVVVFSLRIIQNTELEDQTRQNALELMATFADNSPNMCKKDSIFTEQMVTQCLSLMTDVGQDDDDAQIWATSEDLDVDDSDLNHVAGEQCMDRLANKLGGQVLLGPAFQHIQNMIGSTDWRHRHAALMAISAISEGCHDEMLGNLGEVVERVVVSLKDPHPRVKWAACNAIGQMSTDFAPNMQESFHKEIFREIIPVLKSTEARVQSHAAAALVNFCEEAEKEILAPYLDELLANLMDLLNSPKRFVQEQALSTIATVADSAEEAFGRYYDSLMPALFSVLQNVQDKELRLLRAKAMECATLIALAVGRERMGQEANKLVELLLHIQQGIEDADDPQSGYILHCWGRMCRVLGQDFIPYLPEVMKPLMLMAEAKADIQLLEDEEQVAKFENEDGWELVPLKDKFIGIRTSILDDKHTAIELIVIYAQHLEAAFGQYVETIMQRVAIPGLAFFFHDPVRIASAKAIPQLLNSYNKLHGINSPQAQALWAGTIEKVIEVLDTEPAIETLTEMYQCYYESVEVMGQNCLTAQHMKAFVQAVSNVLKEYEERTASRGATNPQDREDGWEEDNEEEQMAIEDDQTLLSDMNKAFHTTMKHHGASFLPYWEELMPYYDRFVHSPDPTQRQWALCIFDDALEFAGPESWRYAEHIVQPLLTGIRDVVPANRQAAAYGAGVAAQRGGPEWAQFSVEALQPLYEATQVSDARGEEYVYATENACAAIAKVLQCNSSKLPPERIQEVAAAWVGTLPITNDEEAAPFAYAFLASLIEQQNPAAYAAPAAVFTYIAQALQAETLQGATAGRVISAGKTLMTSSGVDAAQVLASMEPELQVVVRRYFA